MSLNKSQNSNVLEVIARSGVLAVIRLDDLSRANQLVEALLEGGLTALEFTLTNPAALEALVKVKAAFPHFTGGQAAIGVGTVLDEAQARASIEAGAQFLVSPYTNFKTIAACREAGVAAIPGALTPGEIAAAWEAGATAVKVFPARAFGPSYLKDLREPLPFLKLLPTGGINLDNAGDYIKNGAVAIGVGGNLVDKKLVAAGDWPGLKERAAAYVEAVRQARG